MLNEPGVFHPNPRCPSNRGVVTRTAIVALGGNALTAAGQLGTYEQQRANAASMAVSICELIDAGWRVVVVHGNGPQVGNLAIQQQRGRDEVPEMPLFSLDAMTQGQLGSLIAIALYRAGGGRHHIAEDSGRGYRRVVASPQPL